MSLDGAVEKGERAMRVNLPFIPFAISVRVRRRPLHLRRPRFTLRRMMLFVAGLGVSLGWIDWRERSEAVRVRSILGPRLPEQLRAMIYERTEPWGSWIGRRLPMHLLGLALLWLAVWLAVHMGVVLWRAFRGSR